MYVGLRIYVDTMYTSMKGLCNNWQEIDMISLIKDYCSMVAPYNIS